MKLISFLIIALLFASCSESSDSPGNRNPIANDTPKDMSDIEVHFPNAPGANEFRKSCITCHSYRYIEMQPEFSEKTWSKIVDKMIHSFGAPIDSLTARSIVGYLVTIKGKKDK